MSLDRTDLATAAVLMRVAIAMLRADPSPRATEDVIETINAAPERSRLSEAGWRYVKRQIGRAAKTSRGFCNMVGHTGRRRKLPSKHDFLGSFTPQVPDVAAEVGVFWVIMAPGGVQIAALSRSLVHGELDEHGWVHFGRAKPESNWAQLQRCSPVQRQIQRIPDAVDLSNQAEWPRGKVSYAPKHNSSSFLLCAAPQIAHDPTTIRVAAARFGLPPGTFRIEVDGALSATPVP
jgi:hypothetical protein